MPYDAQGVKFVLTAPDTESTEQAFSPWKQMVYASAVTVDTALKQDARGLGSGGIGDFLGG